MNDGKRQSPNVVQEEQDVKPAAIQNGPPVPGDGEAQQSSGNRTISTRLASRRTTMTEGGAPNYASSMVFANGVGGAVSTRFKRAAMGALGIDPLLPVNLANVDFDRVIPESLREGRTGAQIRRTLKHHAYELLIRRRSIQIARQNASIFSRWRVRSAAEIKDLPLEEIQRAINDAAKRAGWNAHIPCARSFAHIALVGRVRDRPVQEASTEEAQTPALTAVAATSASVGTSPTRRGNGAPSSQDVLVASPSVQRRSEIRVVRNAPITSSSATSRSPAVDVGDSNGRNGFAARLNSLCNEMYPVDAANMMTRINQHIQNEMIAQLTDRVHQNFDPPNQTRIFNDILGMFHDSR